MLDILTGGNLISDSIGLSLFYLGRDFFLLPVKFGNDSGCESLQKKVDNLKEKMGVHIPIKVASFDWMPWAAHGGVVYGKGGITVPSSETWESEIESDDTQIAILAHEISHIKHNDGAWMLVIALVSLVASTVFLWYVLPMAMVPIAGYLAQIPCLAAIFIRSIYQERRADREASKYLTNDQKRAFADWFEEVRQRQLDYRNEKGLSWLTQLWRKCRVDSDGNSLLGRLTHPSFSERIQYFRGQVQDGSKQRSPFASVPSFAGG